MPATRSNSGLGLVILLPTLVFLYSIIANALESMKSREDFCRRELKVCHIWHDNLRHQLDLMTEQNERLKTENSALKGDLQFCKDALPKSAP